MAFRQLFARRPRAGDMANPVITWLLEAWNVVGQVQEWVEIGGSSGEPAFENSWANVGGSTESAAFYRDPFKRVHLKGNIGTGTAATTAFTLPAEYRPAATIRIAISGGYVDITNAGLVQPSVSPAYIDGVSFRADQ